MRTPDGIPLILIIGGGYAGAALIIRMLETCRQPLHVVIAEPRAELGRGEAYSTSENAQLMNGPAGNFSIHPQNLSHLAEWVERTGHDTGIQIPPEGAANLFISRNVFGRYVGEELQRAIDRAGAGTHVSHWRSDVVRLRRDNDGTLKAEFSDGRHLRANTAVLATGVFPLAEDPALAPLAGDWRLAKPWQSDRLDRLSRLQDILIVGASLSMVDTVASLETRGYRGRYHVISRRGHLIQAVRPAGEPVPILDPDALPRTTRELLATVIRTRRKLLSEDRDWQVVPLSLRPFILPLWLGASTAERLRFTRHLRALWDVTAHRAAPPSYARIEAAKAEGRFSAGAARLVSAERAGDLVRVIVRPRGERQTREVLVDAIVDARGHQEHDWSRIKAPLVKDLLSTGIVRRHETGFGIDAAADGAVIGMDGAMHRDLFAIGHPLRGVAWESSSLTELRAQAAALAERLSKVMNASKVIQLREFETLA